MKTKYYYYGPMTFKAYHKAAGEGYEVGFVFGKKVLFVGNFIHQGEAAKWWGRMNIELRHFFSKFQVAGNVPKSWYFHFVGNHLYKTYYEYLDRWFAKYNKDYTRAFQRDVRKYQNLKRGWNRNHVRYLKAA